MRDDIPTVLREAAAEPKHQPDFDRLAARGRRQHLARRAATVTVAAVVLVAGGVMLWPDSSSSNMPVIGDGPPAGGPAAPGDDAPASLASPRPVPDDPDPSARAGAAGRHVDCDGPVAQGGWAADFGAPSGAADPESALDEFLADGPFDLPTSGYHQAAAEPGRVLFTHTVDGSSKIAVIVADSTVVVDTDPTARTGWGVETFASCDPAEYAPTTDDELHQSIWTDRDGDRVPTSTLKTFPGPAHCDWQSTTFMYLDDQQYLRDPEHLLTSDTVVPYDGDTELPADAIDTGYRRGNDQLWMAADRSIAYLVTPDHVEAWPSTKEPVACA